MEECKNKLNMYYIPKDYLSIKPSEFSYKLYINLCYYSFWNPFMDNKHKDRVEHYILDYGYKTLSDHFKTIGYNISRIKIQKQIEKNRVYRIKEHEEFNEIIGKNLCWNSPASNFTKISLTQMKEILNEDEMCIRFYILLQGWKYKEINGITREELLSMIGYSNSGNNLNKFSKYTKRLKELNLLEYEKHSTGEGKTYITYHKK